MEFGLKLIELQRISRKACLGYPLSISRSRTVKFFGEINATINIKYDCFSTHFKKTEPLIKYSEVIPPNVTGDIFLRHPEGVSKKTLRKFNTTTGCCAS